MPFIKPKLPAYDGLEWEALPFHERARLVCEAWCLDGYGTPWAIHVVYLLKVLGFVGLWFFFCGFTDGMGSISNIGEWWASPTAFQKAIVLTMMLEGLGIAGSSGPLTGRYMPPFGGFLYFLRPGTIKLPLLPGLPLIGGTRRSFLDVAIYASILGVAIFALTANTIPIEAFIALGVLIPVMGLADKTVFLALRAEHYWPTILCFAILNQWIGGAKAVQLAIWFWAGFSKLNHHFPSVVAVMTSNHPIIQFGWLRRRLYKNFPNDLRPSTATVWLAHIGTLFEFAIPLILAFAVGGWPLVVGLTFMVMLHIFIFSNMPMAVPLEWNVLAVYSAFALFWVHPEISFWQVDSIPLAIFLVVVLAVIPLLGNLFPDRLSFLVSMRYYAGNWPYTIWLFKKNCVTESEELCTDNETKPLIGDKETSPRGSEEKLKKLKMTSPWIFDQLYPFYERSDVHSLVGKVMGFRLMHLQGRAIPELLPKAIDDLGDYTYLDGELIAGLVLGWNFGDGHLNNERLLENIQEQCHFAPEELRCICVEAQPFGRPTMKYRIYDAATGKLEDGVLDVNAMRERQPWEAPQ